jgi:hypothetical protein
MRCPHDCYDSRATTFDGVVTSGADARDDDDEDFTRRHRNFRKLGPRCVAVVSAKVLLSFDGRDSRFAFEEVAQT